MRLSPFSALPAWFPLGVYPFRFADRRLDGDLMVGAPGWAETGRDLARISVTLGDGGVDETGLKPLSDNYNLPAS